MFLSLDFIQECDITTVIGESMTLNEYLRKYKMTADQFAKKAHVSTSAVNKWRIKNRSPDGRSILKISKATKGLVQI